MYAKTIPRILASALTAAYFTGILILPSHAADTVQTAPLAASDVYVYNNMYVDTTVSEEEQNPKSPMLYVTGLTESGYTIRVYGDASKTTLLGTSKLESTARGFTVSVVLSSLSSSGGYVYVTAQKDGETESETTRIAYTKEVNPKGSFKLRGIRDSTAVYTSSGFASLALTKITEDQYIQADVMLSDFPYVGSVTLPIRYDTDYLELVPIKSNGVINKDADGLDYTGNFSFVTPRTGYKAAKACGILPGKDTDFENGAVEDSYPESSGTDADYPYVNTDTGLIKTELMKTPYGPFDEDTGDYSSQCSVLRLVFRVKQAKTGGISSLIHFATVADYTEAYPNAELDEDGNPTDTATAAMYYDVSHPGGFDATLGGTTLCVTPLVATALTAEFSEDNPVSISASDISTLPESYMTSVSSAVIPTDSIKVYNYSNSENDQLGGLDNGIEDKLVLNPSSSTSAVKYNDKLTVYSDIDLTNKIGSGLASPDGEVEIGLWNKLNKDGGTVYITKTRGSTESGAISLDYAAEADRTVTFKVYRSQLPDGIADGTDLKENPAGMKNIQRGEQIQLRIYFNNITDLMGYALPIHFNTRCVSPADASFRALPSDGYVSETDYLNGASPFTVGSDLSSLTLNDLIIYYADENEIEDIISTMGLSGEDEFYEKKSLAEAKIKLGASLGQAWTGGLLFTGARASPYERTAYPYVDNNITEPNSAHDGLIKIFSSAMTSPISELRSENGYHFLSVNFIGTANIAGEGADFREATYEDESYDAAYSSGAKLSIAGPEDVGGNFNSVWQVYSMSSIESGPPEIVLGDGNATEEDIEDFGGEYGVDASTVFVYSKYRYRDPGFVVYNSDGTIPTDEELKERLKRYYIDGGEKVELPLYSDDEILATDASNADGATAEGVYFGMTAEDYSKTYELVYEYTDPSYAGEDGEPIPVTASRRVIMIYKRGDVDRNGNIGQEITLNDFQAVKNHVYDVKSLDISDTLYLQKTANVDKLKAADNQILTLNDFQSIKNDIYSIKEIEQDYQTDSENMKMSF